MILRSIGYRRTWVVGVSLSLSGCLCLSVFLLDADMRNPERGHVKTPDKLTGRTVTTQHCTVSDERKKESAETSHSTPLLHTQSQQTLRKLCACCNCQQVCAAPILFTHRPDSSFQSVQAALFKHRAEATLSTDPPGSSGVPRLSRLSCSPPGHCSRSTFLLEVKALVQNAYVAVAAISIHRSLHLVRAHYSQPRFHTASVHMRLQHKRSLNSPSGFSQSA